MPARNKGAANLTPNKDRTPEALSDMGARGGKKSGEARRRKRETKALLKELLALTPKCSKATLAKIARMGYDVETMGGPTVETLIQLSIANNAIAGDLAAAKFLYDYAQIPDIKATLERERLKAQAEGRARLDVNLTQQTEERDALTEIRRRMGFETVEDAP